MSIRIRNTSTYPEERFSMATQPSGSPAKKKSSLLYWVCGAAHNYARAALAQNRLITIHWRELIELIELLTARKGLSGLLRPLPEENLRVLATMREVGRLKDNKLECKG